MRHDRPDQEPCGASVRSRGRKHVCNRPVGHEKTRATFEEIKAGLLEDVHRDSSSGHTWKSRPWQVEHADGRASRHETLDNALWKLLPANILPDGLPGKPVRIVRPGWSGCLVPAGAHRGGGVNIEPYALDDQPNTTGDREKWLKALARTSAWQLLPRERPLVPNDLDAMELWNDTH